MLAQRVPVDNRWTTVRDTPSGDSCCSWGDVRNPQVSDGTIGVVGTVRSGQISCPDRVLGRLGLTASQTGKYESLNEDGRSVAHAMDMATEIGAAIAADGPSADGDALVPWAIWVRQEKPSVTTM